MKTWPRSAWIVIGLLAAACFILPIIAYLHAREAYLDVGVNDGRVDQSLDLIKRIEQLAPVNQCNSSDGKQKELIAAKDESLYVSVANDGTVRFCR